MKATGKDYMGSMRKKMVERKLAKSSYDAQKCWRDAISVTRGEDPVGRMVISKHHMVTRREVRTVQALEPVLDHKGCDDHDTT
jgi:chorismate-pyruvate lyase